MNLLLSAALATSILPGAAEAQLTAGVSGAVRGDDFTGAFVLLRFVVENGQLFAAGALTDVPNVGSTDTVRIPVTTVTGTCEMLRLDLGPIDLTLDGAPVHVNEFGVHFSAAGGGPLRESLCSIANALGDVNSLVRLMSQLLDVVGCLMRGATHCSNPGKTALFRTMNGQAAAYDGSESSGGG